MTAEEKAAKKNAEAKAKLEAKQKAEEEAKTTATAEKAQQLGIRTSKVKMTGFKSKKGVTPAQIEKEEKKHKDLAVKRTENRIAKAKAKAKMKPIDRRKALLAGRFKAVRSRTRAHTYSEKNLEAWLEEYNLIKNNPKRWNKITQNGKLNYTPGNKKKKTAKDILDGMNFDDED